MSDIRLYSFDHASLRVIGHKNSKLAKGRYRHLFTSFIECEEHVKYLIKERKYNVGQYVIVDYSEMYRAKILKVIDNSIDIDD